MRLEHSVAQRFASGLIHRLWLGRLSRLVSMFGLLVVIYYLILDLNNHIIDLGRTLWSSQRILPAFKLVYFVFICLLGRFWTCRILLSPMDDLLSYDFVFPYLTFLCTLVNIQTFYNWRVDVALI